VGKFEGLLIMTNTATKERTLTPQEVRAILNTDNKEIIELCKKASIMPRKNNKGMTYFSYEEVKNLRKVQSAKGTAAKTVTSPIVSAKTSGTGINPIQATAFQNILSSIQNMESNLSDKIAKVIDEKLEGMDEVVVELIRCKTDNETLRQKIVELNKEVYQLKNNLNSYKPVGLGFYVKKEQHAWNQ
jgi:polyhydroxyalkanoate synthesis regulator phasin